MFCVFLKEKAWMEMIDGTKEELLLMSQWAITLAKTEIIYP